VNNLFRPPGDDIEELNLAYEDITRQLLNTYKTNFWTCADLLHKLLRKHYSAAADPTDPGKYHSLLAAELV
jgi:hypothetical protein